MTKRERNLMGILIGAVVIVGGFFLVIKWFRDPLQNAEAKARTAAVQTYQLSKRWEKLQEGEKELETWREIGLSGNTDKAIMQYTKYLQHTLLENSGLTYSKVESLSDGTKRYSRDTKKPSHTALNYAVNAKGKLKNFVQFMRDFYRTQLPHRIKELRVDRYTRSADTKDPELSIAMNIEVLVVHPEKGQQPKLLRKVDIEGFQKSGEPIDETKLMQLAKLNLFHGYEPPPPPRPKKKWTPKPIFVKKNPPPPKPGFDMRPYMKLISINLSDQDIDGFPGTYATVHNLVKPDRSDESYTNMAVRNGYDLVQIMDTKEVQMQLFGRVLLVDYRDVYIQQWADDKAKAFLASTLGMSHSPLSFAPLLPASLLTPGRLDVYRLHIGDNVKNAMKSPVEYSELWNDGITERMAEAASKWDGPSESEVSKAGAE